MDEKNKLFCNIIKDADKLDIFYLWSIDKIKLLSDDSDISEIINDEFYQNKLLKKEAAKSNNDNILLSL